MGSDWSLRNRAGTANRFSASPARYSPCIARIIRVTQ